MTRRLALLLTATMVACAPPAEPPPAPDPVEVPVVRAPERPLPAAATAPLAFREAVARGTRTVTGHPGPAYWQQQADYRILASLDTEARRVEGITHIRYRNRSPDTLTAVFLHLHQNLHGVGVVRNEPQEVTGGMMLERVAVEGRSLPRARRGRSGYQEEGTLLGVPLPGPLAPGGETHLEVGWSFDVPRSGAGRMGWDRDDLFFLAYWYPQMAVYDDLGGWHTDPYRGQGEFYMGFGDYEVVLSVPEGWVVRATGELQNPHEVFPAPVIARLEEAARSDLPVTILGPGDFGPGTATVERPGGTLEWHFRAENVRDFSFSATRASRWEAARAPVGDRTGAGGPDHTRVEVLFRDTAPLWTDVADYARHAISFLSDYLGHPYPWPHITAVEGGDIIAGGMEFPMMTLMGDYNERGDVALYGVTAHELAHMWIPMIVGVDEKRYGWLDEGHTSFHTSEAVEDFYGGREDRHGADLEAYLRAARAEGYERVSTWTDFHPTPLSWITATYRKPAVLLVALRGLLGEEVFTRAGRAFVERWAYRHPSPWDFFHTVEDVSGRDLGWFWQSWYGETWVLDQAVVAVLADGSGTTVVIEDRGDAPMPVELLVTREDGASERASVPVEHWLAGHRTAEVDLPAGPRVVRVEIDPDGAFPYLDRGATVWEP